MRHAALAFVAATLLAGLAPPAFAQAPAGDTADVRCLLVLQAVGNDPKQREAAARGIYYYLGKLSARGPVGRAESLMVAEGKKMNAAPIVQGELSRCGGELSQKTSELQAVNQRLQKAFGPPTAAPAAAPPAKK
jgi:hypothetical protein